MLMQSSVFHNYIVLNNKTKCELQIKSTLTTHTPQQNSVFNRAMFSFVLQVGHVTKNVSEIETKYVLMYFGILLKHFHQGYLNSTNYQFKKFEIIRFL